VGFGDESADRRRPGAPEQRPHLRPGRHEPEHPRARQVAGPPRHGGRPLYERGREDDPAQERRTLGGGQQSQRPRERPAEQVERPIARQVVSHERQQVLVPVRRAGREVDGAGLDVGRRRVDQRPQHRRVAVHSGQQD
jgi:hypothetical protein